MENLAKAILAVMKETKGIEKSMTIGTGQNSYKGVPDQEVKKIIGESMQKNGLCLLPIEINPITKIDRWEEDTNYGKKMKQSVFTEATTKYLLLHESGESQIVCGYGQGVDSQDKSAGKATTYALKYLMLYLFLVPTGKIDDADNEHSDGKEIPKTKTNIPPPKQTVKEKKPLAEGSLAFTTAHQKLHTGEITMDDIEERFTVTENLKTILLKNP